MEDSSVILCRYSSFFAAPACPGQTVLKAWMIAAAATASPWHNNRSASLSSSGGCLGLHCRPLSKAHLATPHQPNSAACQQHISSSKTAAELLRSSDADWSCLSVGVRCVWHAQPDLVTSRDRPVMQPSAPTVISESATFACLTAICSDLLHWCCSWAVEAAT